MNKKKDVRRVIKYEWVKGMGLLSKGSRGGIGK